MGPLEGTTIGSIVRGGEIHSLYAVFCPGAVATRTIQVRADDECHAFVDIDEFDLPVALELRGWKLVRMRGEPPKPESRDRIVKILFAMACELIKEHRDQSHAFEKASHVFEEAGNIALQEA